MSVINTNYLSLVAQNNLQKSQSALGTAIERLSSGLRINSAKDDAAGQAIANRMGAQINGLNQAARNANDGISAAQTTEGALNQINDNLQRIRVLTVQAANGTNSQDDLTSIQNEIGQRLEEINRVSSQTEFNGVKVLQEDSSLRIQVGANDSEVINIDLQKIDATTLGLNKFTVSGDKAATIEDMRGFGAAGTSNFTVDVYDDAGAVVGTAAKVDIVNGSVTSDGTTPLYVSQTTGRITTEATNTAVASAVASTQADEFATSFATKNQGDTATIGGVTWTRETAGADADGNGTYTATLEGQVVKVTIADADTTATLNVSQGNLFMDEATFAAGTTKFTTYGTNEAAREVDLKAAGAAYTGSTLTLGADEFAVDTGGVITATTIDAGSSLNGSVDVGDVIYVKNAGQASQKLISQDDAVEASRNPLEKLDAALGLVDALRSDLGAIQNRFESAITNLQTTSNNLASAQSRIQDADYSVEVANMTRAQILQQAGTSVLAQANQIPQGVLSLLR
ncbi:flagellin FliC [Pusillimonas sp. T2]|uniref:flagellin N-terminal helical domain-containing protein n=1 Tax=Pusillimonas sp. T2 TaxID=1548123 RepID=UPI000B9CF043|nr:flagellin [Pusillimonas sp. T2]OXR49543.1 flagellin FliC [Pusillimonas sp. T2]